MMPRRRASDIGSAESSLQIGLVPLIDLSLTLVVVFLVFMPMALTSLIPISSSAKGAGAASAAGPQEGPILLEVEPAAVRVGPVKFESELALTAWLKDNAASRSNRLITVKVAPEVLQERLVQVLDWVRGTAEWKVTLMTLKETPSSEARP